MYDAIILGAGAAGLMCAAHRRPARPPRAAGRPCRQAGQEDPDLGRRPLQLHQYRHRARPLSLGQTPISPSRRSAATPRRISSTWSSARHRLARKDARPALLRRLRAADRRHAAGRMRESGQSTIGSASPEVEHADGRFRVTFGNASPTAPALVIATGGPSIPKMGATGFAYDLARRFGLKVVEPRPALGPAHAGGDEALFRELSGVAPTSSRARQGRVPRSGAVHPSRPVRPGDPAGLLLLAPRRERSASTSCPAAPGWLPKPSAPAPASPCASCSARCCPIAWPKRWPRLALPGELANTADRKLQMPSASSPTGASPRRHRRLRQGRSHDRRDQHRRTLLADDGGAQGPRPLCDRRGGGRHRLAGRL
jgi:hypothetical protein